jgi:hypothetical protein
MQAEDKMEGLCCAPIQLILQHSSHHWGPSKSFSIFSLRTPHDCNARKRHFYNWVEAHLIFLNKSRKVVILNPKLAKFQ